MEKETKIVDWEQDFLYTTEIASEDKRVQLRMKTVLKGEFNL
jgi:hypothetical protein